MNAIHSGLDECNIFSEVHSESTGKSSLTFRLSGMHVFLNKLAMLIYTVYDYMLLLAPQKGHEGAFPMK